MECQWLRHLSLDQEGKGSRDSREGPTSPATNISYFYEVRWSNLLQQGYWSVLPYSLLMNVLTDLGMEDLVRLSPPGSSGTKRKKAQSNL